MGIYQRDNINYGGMLGNAMRDRANYLANKRALEVQNAQNWGNAIQKSGQAVSDALNKYAYTKWGYDQDMNKLETQQGFQKDMKEYELAEALKRAREQQNWQAIQNDLNRQNTYDIAVLNRDAGIAKKAEEDTMKADYDYQFNKSMVAMIQNEMDNTEDQSKKERLGMELLKYKNKVDLYEGKNNIKPDPLEFSQEFLDEANKPAPQPKITEQLTAVRTVGQNYQKNSLTDNEKALADYDALLTEDNKKIIEATYGKKGLDDIIKERTKIEGRIKAVKQFRAGKQQYIANLNSGKQKFDTKNKYGVKEEVVKDPTTGQWVKIYK